MEARNVDRSDDTTSVQALSKCLQEIIDMANTRSQAINDGIEQLAQKIETLRVNTEKLQEQVEKKRTS